MYNKIGFVAVGQAGGNIGRLLEKRSFSVLYMNTSLEDLATLKDVKYKYHITGGEGCNKDRKKAKQLVIDDFDNIFNKIKDTLKVEMIFVIFAAGGGTGSGAGPMLADMLIAEGVDVGVITILPAKNESVKTQINAYECFAELVSIENTGSCFVIDNEKSADRLNLNATFVNAFNAYIQIPMLYHNKKGNIDTAEIMESFKAHGMTRLKQYASTVIADLVNIESDIFAPMEHDKTIKYLVCACDESVSDMQEIITAAGEPFDIFRAYTQKEAILLMSGLSYPMTRLEAINERIQSNKETIVKNLSSGLNASLTGTFDFLTPKQEQKPKKVHKTRDDIFSKYL